jgi:hypothetical protein
MSRINVANFRHPDGTGDNISLDSSGRVGIGTASPSTTLAVAGGISGTAGTNVSGSGWGVLPYVANSFVVDSTSGQTRLFATGTDASTHGNLLFFTGTTNGTASERARITSTGDFKFNSGYGSAATAYGCRAWVNFNGTGTVAIRASGNVSSITDNAVGDYTVNFSNAMSDTNYAFALSKSEAVSELAGYNATVSMVSISAGSIRIRLRYTNGVVGDDDYFCVAIFR